MEWSNVAVLHFHLGSQITDVRRLKAAVIEATRIYADLKTSGLPLGAIDVGVGWESIIRECGTTVLPA